MTATATPETHTPIDRYPSRGTLKAQLVDRQDPVIYASATKAPPVGQA